MVNKRDRILNFVKYLKELGIEVNLNRNKARGNKGFFRTVGSNYRIDIAKGLSEDEQLSVLLHEFAHYIHFSYDKKLQNLDFIFDSNNEEILEELISLTVNLVPKKDAIMMFENQKEVKSEIKILLQKIKYTYPDFKITDKNKKIERKICARGFAPLLKYDSVKVFNFLSFNIYRVSDSERYFNDDEKVLAYYLQLKSKKRALNRINSRISKLNKYYNSNTELFARAFELFFTNKNLLLNKAPNVLSSSETIISENKNNYFNACYKIINL